MAAILVASCLAFVGLLFYADRAARPHAAAWREIERKSAERRAMPLEVAREVAEHLVANEGVSEPWTGDIPEAVVTRLTALDPDVRRLLERHKRLAFPASNLTFGAEYMLAGAGWAPAGTSQIGVDDDDGFIFCAYHDGRPDIVSLSLPEGDDQESYRSIYHCIALLADENLGERATGASQSSTD